MSLSAGAWRSLPLLPILLIPTCLPGCSENPTGVEVKAARYLMGTELQATIRADSREKGLSALEAAFGEVERLETLLSNWRVDSEVSRLCALGSQAPVPLSPDTVRALGEAFRIAEESDGAFHPALGGLLDLWGFYAPSSPRWRPPSSGSVRRSLGDSDWKWIRVRREGGTWKGRLTAPGPRLDLGGIGKGHALDEAAKRLRRAGIREGLLNFGGNVLLVGKPSGERALEIPLRSPSGKAGEWWEPLFVKEGSISVSGNYEKFREWDGRRYGHILDPRTGYPTRAEGCVVVWAPTATLADAWSTAFWVMGPDRALASAPEKGLEAMFLLKDDSGVWIESKTEGFKQLQEGSGTDDFGRRKEVFR